MVEGDEMRPDRSASVKFTLEDFLNFPDDGKRHEIIDGDHYVTPSPKTRHQMVSMNLTRAFVLYLDRHPIGRLFAAPFDVVLSDLDVVEPDLLYISNERTGILTDAHVRGAPDIVIEILSSGTRRRDEGIKRKLYERVGVREYWLVDPEIDSVKVFRQVDGVFVRVAELSVEANDTLTTPLLPSFSAPLAEIFSPAT